jgi:hypothetical protein
MEPRNDEKREPQKAPEVRQEQPRLRRFHIVKLEERIAPLAGGDRCQSLPTFVPFTCI